MKYISTRGSAAPVSAERAILSGIAPDGGLYLPETLPQLSEETLAQLRTMPYRETALRVMQPFLPSFTAEELTACINDAYLRFDTKEPLRFQALDEKLTVMELWHGPTAAFKDMALQLFPRLLPLCKKKCGNRDETWILTATSGDTGKAALEGFRDVPGTRIFVFYPFGGVSKIQELQMTTQQGSNVAVYAVRGNFDDAQTGVKRLFADERLKKSLKVRGIELSSANSINWGRLLPQIVYYVYASAHLSEGEPVDFVVPTGNFGNILAAYLAKRMGAPVGRLICASNENRVLTDFFETGVYDRNRAFYKTYSPSMDILISSNLERLLYYATDGDTAQVAAWMRELQTTGSYRVPVTIMSQLRAVFGFGSADDEDTQKAIRLCKRKSGYLLDPHTAVGYSVYRALPESGRKTALVSTASPFKFAQDVLRAFMDANTDGFTAQDLLSMQSGRPVPQSLSRLKDMPVRFHDVIAPKDMEKVLG